MLCPVKKVGFGLTAAFVEDAPCWIYVSLSLYMYIFFVPYHIITKNEKRNRRSICTYETLYMVRTQIKGNGLLISDFLYSLPCNYAHFELLPYYNQMQCHIDAFNFFTKMGLYCILIHYGQTLKFSFSPSHWDPRHVTW